MVGRAALHLTVIVALFLLVTSVEASSDMVESDWMVVSTDAATGRSALRDKRSGVVWELGVVGEMRPADDGRSLSITGAPGPGQTIRLLDSSLAVAADDSGCALVPAREGLLIPADRPVEFTRSFGTSSYEGCHMNMVGFVKRGSALLMTWDDPYVTPELKKTKLGLTCTVHVRRPAHGAKSPVSVKLTPLGPGDWDTVASAYREVAGEKGLLVTLREKVRRNPEAAKLLGASNAKLWTCLCRRRNEESTRDEEVKVMWSFGEAAQIAEHLKRDLEIDRCLFILGGWSEGGYDCRHPDVLPANPECGGNEGLADAVRRIKALGYVACFHDNYQDMYRDAKSWSPDFIQKKPDGAMMAGGRWLGGRAWLVCAPKTLELAQRPENLPAVQKLFGPQACFIDTTYAVGPQECHDPKHPLSYADDIVWKQRLSDYARGVFGLFGSECGREWAIPHSDFFEGLSGVGGKYYHNLDPAALGATVIPLFEMVYHDCEVVFGKYGYNPDGAAEYVLHHVLCGRTLHYHSFPQHLYWNAPTQEHRAKFDVRPGVASVSQIADRRFRITYRWTVGGEVTGDWRVFVHLGAGQPIPFANDHVPSRPLSTWRAGEVIEDGPFEVTVPAKVTAEAVDVFVGLCRGETGSERARLPGSGPDYRVLVGRLRLKPTIVFEKAEPRQAPGDPGCFARADNGWADGLCLTDRFLKNTHEVLGPLAQLTANARIVKFEFLTNDRAVRRATFGEDGKAPAATITANFGAEDYVAKSPMGGDVSLPTYGFLIESPTFVAFHATSWAGRRYEKPVLFTLRLEGGRWRVFHGFGDADLTWQGRELHVPRGSETPL